MRVRAGSDLQPQIDLGIKFDKGPRSLVGFGFDTAIDSVRDVKPTLVDLPR